MSNPILYTTGCPRCNVLEKKLKNANIDFDICTNTDIMLEKNIIYAPALEVDNKLLDFKEAVKWVGEQNAD